METNLSAQLPLMLKKQEALLNDNGDFSYINNGTEVKINKNEFNKITFIKTVFYFMGVIPLKVWDIEIVDINNKKHIIKNLKKNSKESIVSKCKNKSTIIVDTPPETGVLFFDVIRDHSGRAPKWISVIVSIIVLLLLMLTMYTFWFNS